MQNKLHYNNFDIEDINGEIWVPVLGFEKLYHVSNFGRVKSLDYLEKYFNKESGKIVSRLKKQKIKCQKISKQGYIGIKLYKDKVEHTTRVHRIVAESFLPNPNLKKHVNHKNGIKHDNRLCNLEWATPSENNKHAFRKGLRIPTCQKGFKNSNCKLSPMEIKRIRNHKKKYGEAKKLCQEMKISLSHYHNIRNGKVWSEIT